MLLLRLFLAAGLAAIVPGFAVAQSERTLSDWVKDLDSDHPLVLEEAIEMIGTFGSGNMEAIAKIESLLKDPKPRVRVRCAVVLLRLGGKPEPLVPVLIESARKCGVMERLLALEHAIEHGHKRDDTVALLTELLLERDARINSQAEARLMNSGPISAPILLQLARHADNDIVVWMLRLVDRQRLESATIEASLKPLLKDRPPAIRGLAMSCLIRGKADLEPLLPTIKELLGDNDYQAKQPVLYALCDLGVKNKELAPVLEVLMKDNVPGIRVRAAATLWEIDGRTRDVIAILVSCMAPNTESSARQYAELMIPKMGDAAAELIPAYLSMVRRGPPGQYLMEHAQTLGRLGVKAVDPLLKYSDDSDPGVRQLVSYSLGRIGEKAVPAVLKEFEKSTGNKRITLINAFTQMRSGAEAATAALVDALGGDDAVEQRAIGYALSAIGPCAKPALPKLIAMLKDLNASKVPRNLVIEIIGSIGPWAGSAVPGCIDILKNENHFINERITVAFMLGSIGAPAKDAIPHIIELSNKDPGTFRAYLLQAGFQIDPGDKDVHQAIIDLSKVSEQRSKIVTLARALSQYGDALEPILPALIAAQKGQPVPPLEFIQMLGLTGCPHPEAVEYLKVASDHRDATISAQAALALARLGIFNETNVDRLAQIVMSRDFAMRHYVLEEVVKQGSKAQAFAPSLLRAWQQEENQDMRLVFARALAIADPSIGKPVVNYLREYTKKPEPYHCVHAAMSLWRIDKTYDPLPVLRKAIKTPALHFQQGVVAMGDMRSAGKDAIPDLEKLIAVKSDDYTLKGPALVAMLKIDPSRAESLKPVVAELLKNRDPRWMSVRQDLAQLLGAMGTKAKPLLPILLEGLRRAEAYERNVYLVAIRRIDPHAATIENE